MGPGSEQIPRIKSVVFVFICFYLETGGLPLEYKSFLSKVPRLLNRGNSKWITVLFHTIRGDGGDVVLVCC